MMTEKYIEHKYNDIKKYASIVEERLDDSDCTKEVLICDNKVALEQCIKHECDFWLIDNEYDVDKWLEELTIEEY